MIVYQLELKSKFRFFIIWNARAFNNSFFYIMIFFIKELQPYEIWWLWVDLNHRPQHYECCALTS